MEQGRMKTDDLGQQFPFGGSNFARSLLKVRAGSDPRTKSMNGLASSGLSYREARILGEISDIADGDQGHEDWAGYIEAGSICQDRRGRTEAIMDDTGMVVPSALGSGHYQGFPDQDNGNRKGKPIPQKGVNDE